MRQAYAHQATVVLGEGVDPGAVGAAITDALCGFYQHEPPCPLAPHHTRMTAGRVRVLFVTEPNRADEVRAKIEAALAGGAWRVVEAGCARVEADERGHARRLLKSR
jgi:hypothetical protein